MRHSPPEQRGRHLLVVDDEPSISALLKQVLEMEGFQVTEAGSAGEAIRALARRDVDLLVTDIQMPEVTGLELAEAARAEHPTLPILLMSGSAPGPIAVACGCSFLRKPFSLGELAAKVREMLPAGRRPGLALPLAGAPGENA